MNLRKAILLLGVLGNFSGALSQTAQPTPTPAGQDEVLRISTALVTVPVNAHDRRGKVAYDLRREDFKLLEDGVPQEIVYFDAPKRPGEPQTAEAPLTVALLLDVSDSTEFKLKQIQAAAVSFTDQLQPDDRVLVIAFDKNVSVLAEATSDRNALRAAIGRTRTGGGTSLYSAVDIALNQELRNVSGRKAVVLFTDGVDTASVGSTIESTVAAAAKSDAVIYPVQYDTYSDFAESSRQPPVGGPLIIAHATKNGELASQAYKRAGDYLRLLAATTAGHVEYSDSLKNLARAFGRIALRLGEQYTLGYYPKNHNSTGLPRRLSVEVTNPQIKITARKSYVYAPR